jgi:small subunit ribosomal protein S18
MSENPAIGNGKKRLADYFIQNKVAIDYKNVEVLRRFMSLEAKILPSRRSGLTAANQRKATKAIKMARAAGLLPFKSSEA